MLLVRVEQAQIEVARDAWQEDEGASDRWRDMLKEHPRAVQNYIGKRFERERDDLAREIVGLGGAQRFRITSLTYERDGTLWNITDNTPGV